MKTLQINTTQNVMIDFELANVGQRLLAFIIDNVVKFGYLYFIFEVFDFSLIKDATEGDYWSAKAIVILMFLPITFYSLYSEILMNGQTLGKRILGLRVINVEGFKPSIGDYIIRWFMRMIDFNLFILLFVYFYSTGYGVQFLGFIYMILIIGKCVGFFMIVFTNKNQRVGDISANTVVVALKDKASFSKTILEDIKEDYKPVFANVIKLSDNDARIIKDTYTRAKNKNDFNTLIKLRSKIEEVTDIRKPKGTSDIDFIGTVLKDFNYYTKD